MDQNSSNSKFVTVIVAVVVIAALGFGVWYMADRDDKKSDTNNSTTAPTTNEGEHSADIQDQSAVETQAVTIQDFAFSPTSIKIKKGTTVTWTNQDSVRHNVQFDDASLKSGELLAKGESFRFTFDTTGTFSYHCQPHPQMTGTVEVTE